MDRWHSVAGIRPSRKVAYAVAASIACVWALVFAVSAAAAAGYKAETLSSSDLYDNGYYIELLKESSGIYGQSASGGSIKPLQAVPSDRWRDDGNADGGRPNIDSICYIMPSLVNNRNEATGAWEYLGGKNDAWAFVSNANSANNGAANGAFSVTWKKAGILRSTNGKLGKENELPGGGIYVDIKVDTKLVNTIKLNPQWNQNLDKAVVQFTNRFDWGFFQFGVTRMDQTFTFIDSESGKPVPLDGPLSILSTSLDRGEGFMVQGAQGSAVSGTAPIVNKQFGGVVDITESRSTIPGSYLYEIDEGGWLGYLGASRSHTTGPDGRSIDYVDNKYNSLDGFAINGTWYPTDAANNTPGITYPWRSASIEKNMAGASSVVVRQYAVGYDGWPTTSTGGGIGHGSGIDVSTLDTTFSDTGTIKDLGSNTSNSVNPQLDRAAGATYGSYGYSSNGVRYFTMAFSGAYGVHPQAPEKFVSAHNERAIGDEVEFQIVQKVNEYGEDLFAPYESFVFSDPLNENLDYVSAKMMYYPFKANVAKGNFTADVAGGKDVTGVAGSASFDAASRTVTYKFKDSYLAAANVGENKDPSKAMVYKSGYYMLVVKAKVKSDAQDTLYNRAHVSINGTAKRSNEVPVIVGSAKLAISKNVKFENAVGDEATFSITVENIKDKSFAQNVVITDTLPNGLEVIPGSLSYSAPYNGKDLFATEGYGELGDRSVVGNWQQGRAGSIIKSTGGHNDAPQLSGNIVKATIKVLPAKTKITLSFKVKLTEAHNGKEFFNTASASLTNPAPDAQKTVTAKDGLWVNNAELSLTKNADKFQYQVGDTATYTIDVTNTAPAGTIAKNVVITDTSMPDRVKINVDSLQVKTGDKTVAWPIDGNGVHKDEARNTAATWEAEGNGFVIRIPYLASGKTARITYTATCTKASNGMETFNSATATLDNPLPGKSKVTSKDGIWVNNAQLSLSKVADTFEYAVGDAITYTLEVENTEKNTIAQNVTVSDHTLPDTLQLDNASIKVSGIPGTISFNIDGKGEHKDEQRENKHVLDANNNGFTLTIPYLPSGNKVVITYVAQALEASNGTEVVNTATASLDNPLDPAKKTIEARETIWVNSVNVSVHKEAETHEYRIGDVVPYTITVENKAPKGTIAKQVRITDSGLPASFEINKDSIKIDGIPTSIDYPVDGNGTHKSEKRDNKATTTPTENGFDIVVPFLPAGGKSVITYTATAGEPTNGTEPCNTVTVQPENPQPGKEQMKSRDGVWVNNASLALTKAADSFEYEVGDTITYTVALENTAEGTIAEDVRIDDVTLPPYLALDPASIQVSGFPASVDFPIDGKGSQKTEERAVEYTTIPSGNGFALHANYLPFGETVVITYQATALEESNGQEVTNTAKATCANQINPDTPLEASDTVWVNSVKFDVEKRADAFEYRVDDTATYTITLVNTAPAGTIARDVRISDLDLPEVVSYNKGSVQVEGVPATVSYPADGGAKQSRKDYTNAAAIAEDNNGFIVDIPLLPAGKLVTITYTATCTKASNGLESFNSAIVTTANPLPGAEETISRDGIWTNDAVFVLDKRVERYEYQVGEEVHYTVAYQNVAPGTIAKNVVMTDTTLPDGLVLQADSVKVAGIPSKVTFNIDGDGTHASEERDNPYEVVTAANSVKIVAPYLPTGCEVVVTYTAIPTEEVNGDEIINTAKVAADNMLDNTGAEDDALIWVNTPHLSITKQVMEPQISYQQGDTITYRIQVDNNALGTFARAIALADAFEKEGMQLVRTSIIAFDSEGNVYDNARYSVKQNMFNANWSIESNFGLVCDDGNHGIWEDKTEREAKNWNPLAEVNEQRIYVEYQAVVTAKELSGKDVVNTAKARGENAEEVQADATITVDDPTTKDPADPQPSTDPEPSTDPKTDPEPITDPKTNPEPTTDPKTNPEPSTDPKTDPDSQGEPKPQDNPTPKPQDDPQSQTEPGPKPQDNPQPQQQDEPEPQQQGDPNPQQQNDPEPQQQDEPKQQPNSEPEPQNSSQDNPDSTPKEDPQGNAAMAKLRVRYVTEEGVLLDAYNHTIPAGPYSTEQKEFSGYEFKTMDEKSDPAQGEVAENQEALVIYIYIQIQNDGPSSQQDPDPSATDKTQTNTDDDPIPGAHNKPEPEPTKSSTPDKETATTPSSEKTTPSPSSPSTTGKTPAQTTSSTDSMRSTMAKTGDFVNAHPLVALALVSGCVAGIAYHMRQRRRMQMRRRARQ